MRKRSWTIDQLRIAIIGSKSIRSTIIKLGLVPAGGNYDAIKRAIIEHKIDKNHFTGIGWRKGACVPMVPKKQLDELLEYGSGAQSYKLKNKLFEAGLKYPKCEMCGWAKISADGRLPLELDHINGDKNDNRLENLRILCPNCHSLQPTHRGRNKRARVAKW